MEIPLGFQFDSWSFINLLNYRYLKVKNWIVQNLYKEILIWYEFSHLDQQVFEIKMILKKYN